MVSLWYNILLVFWKNPNFYVSVVVVVLVVFFFFYDMVMVAVVVVVVAEVPTLLIIVLVVVLFLCCWFVVVVVLLLLLLLLLLYWRYSQILRCAFFFTLRQQLAQFCLFLFASFLPVSEYEVVVLFLLRLVVVFCL